MTVQNLQLNARLVAVVGHISGVIISHHYNLQSTIYNGELQSNDKTLAPY